MPPSIALPALTVKDLKSMGLFDTEGAVGVAIGGIQFSCSLARNGDAKHIVMVRLVGAKVVSQQVYLNTVKKGFGVQHFFVCPKAQERCAKLYLHEGIFVSWEGHFSGERPNLPTRLAEIHGKLRGTGSRGPARGERRRKLVAQCWRHPHLRTANAVGEDLRKQLMQARRALRSSRKTGLSSIVEALAHGRRLADRELATFAGGDAETWRRRIAPPRPPEAGWPDDVLEAYPSLHIGALLSWFQRPDAELWGVELGWPLDLTGGAALRLIVDLRDEERPFLISEGRYGSDAQPQRQVIELVSHQAAAARKMLVCPFRGTRHDVLFFRAGRWGSPGPLKLKHASQMGQVRVAVSP